MEATMLLSLLMITTLIYVTFSLNFDNSSSQQLLQLPKFICNGIQDFAKVSEGTKSVTVQGPETFNGGVRFVEKLRKSQLFCQIFPDKLKNLNGYNYKVGVKFESLESAELNSQVNLIATQLFNALSTAHNASFEVIPVVDKTQHQSFDYFVNPKISIDHNLNTIMLYSRDSICLLISKVKQFSFEDDLLSRNVDEPIRFMVIMIYVTVYIIWKWCENRGAVDRPFDVAFKLLAAYHDQRVNFSRNNRPILTFMLQVLIIMTVFSNLMYQWVIGISFSFPQGELSLDASWKVFDKSPHSKLLVDLDYEEEYLANTSSSREIQRAEFYNERTFDVDGFNHDNAAIIGYCGFIKTLLDGDEYFHRIPDQYSQQFISIEYRQKSPVTETVRTFISYANVLGIFGDSKGV